MYYSSGNKQSNKFFGPKNNFRHKYESTKIASFDVSDKYTMNKKSILYFWDEHQDNIIKEFIGL